MRHTMWVLCYHIGYPFGHRLNIHTSFTVALLKAIDIILILILYHSIDCGLDRHYFENKHSITAHHSNVLIPVVLNELFFYPTPNNFNYFYCVGFLLGLLLCFQFMTGVLLACYYIPKVGIAFTSIDYAIRDVAIG